MQFPNSFALLEDGRLLQLRRVVARGHAYVYLGSLDGRDVAVKLLRDASPQREALILRAVAHPHVVRLIDELPQGIVLEWAGGAPLDRAFSSLSDVWRVRLLAKAAIDALDALDVVHQWGVVHGAVDARHLLVDAEGRVRIIGFGRAAAPSVDRGPRDDVATLARATLAAAPSSFDITATSLESRVLRVLAHGAVDHFRSAAALREAILDTAPVLESLSTATADGPLPRLDPTTPSLYSR